MSVYVSCGYDDDVVSLYVLVLLISTVKLAFLFSSRCILLLLLFLQSSVWGKILQHRQREKRMISSVGVAMNR